MIRMISVVIPNFNSGWLLAKNLPRLLGLLKKSKLEYEVVLADDASTDDSVAIAKKFGLRIVYRATNAGFATNVDAGIRAAKGEVVFTIKTDAVPRDADYFKLMLAHFDDPNVFAVSAALRTIERGREEVRGNGEIYFEKGFFLHRRGSNQAKLSAWADGSASAWRRDLYLKVGGFDSLYDPFYWEDTDLGYRAWKAGYEIHFEPKAVLLHDYETGAIAKHYDRRQVLLISQRNQFIFTWKNADWKHLIFHLAFFIWHFLVALKNGDGDWFIALWQAVLRWSRILAARRRQKKVTRLSCDHVLQLWSR